MKIQNNSSNRLIIIEILLLLHFCTLMECDPDAPLRYGKFRFKREIEDYFKHSRGSNVDISVENPSISRAPSYPTRTRSKSPVILSQNETIQKTLHLLDEGNSRLQLTSHSDIILVVGNTGAGKTTLTHFIAGDDSQLQAYQADEDTILIRDVHQKISSSTIISKTIFPQLYVDSTTLPNTAFYDCPGFSDTRNSTVEIVNSFFLKQVAESARRVKVLLIVNHHSLKSGGDRLDFMLLVKHTIAFLQNTQKFQDSVALVATKVHSTNSELRVINGMASFINSTRHELDSVLGGDDLLKAGQLIDALLTRDEDGDGLYTRLSFFRQPTETGALSAMPSVQERKGHIRNVIWNNIQFIEALPQDFGYTLSHKAQNDVQKLTDAISGQIQNHFGQLSGELKTYFGAKFENRSSASELSGLQGDISLLRNASVNLKNKESTFKNVLSTTLGHFTRLNCTSPGISATIIHNGEYLDFLTGVTDTTNFIQIQNTSQRWFEPLRSTISLIESQLENFCLRLDGKMEHAMEELGNVIQQNFIQNFGALQTAPNLTRQLHHLLDTLNEMEAMTIPIPGSPSALIRQILQATSKLELDPKLFRNATQRALTQTASFLDSCQNQNQNQNSSSCGSSASALTSDLPRWLSRYRHFVDPVKSKFGVIEGAIQTKIREILTNLTDYTQQNYNSKFHQYKTMEKENTNLPMSISISILLEKDLSDFLDLFNDIGNYSSPKNNRTDIQFLSRISIKLANKLEISSSNSNSENLNQQINEQIRNLEFLRAFSQEYQVPYKRENDWLLVLNGFKAEVGAKFHDLFHHLDKKTKTLLENVSGQLGEFFQHKFQQLKMASVTTAEFKSETVFLLSRLRDIENLRDEDLVDLGPSQFWHQLSNETSKLMMLSSFVPILKLPLSVKLEETSRCLDLSGIFNRNMEAAANTTRTRGLAFRTNQSEWLRTFKKFVPVTKGNSTILMDETHLRIRASMTNLARAMESHYARQFSQAQGPQDKSKDEIINFRESLQRDLNTFEGVLGNLNYSQAAQNASNFLYRTGYEFSRPCDFESGEGEGEGDIPSILRQLRSLGECVDFAQSYLDLAHQFKSSDWFSSLQSFVGHLNRTVNGPPTCRRNLNPAQNQNDVIIEGTFVHISQVLEYINSSRCIPRGQFVENLIILSLHTVYIDEDIIGRNLLPEANSQLNVAIISPHWVVQGTKTIDLNGSPGKAHKQPKGGHKRRGEGLAGVPGLPGQNAGNFFGAGLTLCQNGTGTGTAIQRPPLQVWASGGHGGPGQEGGDGLDGAPGENVTLDKIDYEVKREGVYTNHILITKHHPFPLKKGGLDCRVMFDMYSCTEYFFNGTKGEHGKKGGSGGAGGFGGKAGLLTLFGSVNFTSVFNNSDATTQNTDGSMGLGGEGGEGGLGGIHGLNARVLIYPGKHNVQGYVNGKRLILNTTSKGAAQDGKRGKNNFNAGNRKQPPLPHSTSTLTQQLSALNNFRNFARHSFGNPIVEESILQFLNELDQKLLSLQPTPLIPLLDEFLDLESQYFELKSQGINCIQFYQQFSNNILHALNSNLTSTNFIETNKVLTYLYTASLSRINSIDNTRYESESSSSSSPSLITDMTAYLNLVQRNLQSFQQQSHNLNALSIIRNVTQDHTQQIQNDIQAAQDFITNEIQPEIGRIQTELDDSVDLLLDEILQLKLQISSDQRNLSQIKHVLEEGVSQQVFDSPSETALRDAAQTRTDTILITKKKSDLRSKLVQQTLFKVINIGSIFLSFIGPIGSLLGKGVRTGMTMHQIIARNNRNEENYNSVHKRNTLDYIMQSCDKLSSFRELLNDIKAKLMSDPATFENLIGEVNRISIETEFEKTKLELQAGAIEREANSNNYENPADRSPFSFNPLDFIRYKKAKLRSDLNVISDLIRNQTTTTSSNLNLNANLRARNINLINRIYDDLRMDPHFYLKIRNDQTKIDEVTVAIRQTEDKLQKLDKFSLKVENEMSSVLEQFYSELENNSTNSMHKFESGATGIDRITWRISRQLQKMKNLIRTEFTQNYKNADDEVNLAFQKLKEGFGMVTRVYERIAQSEKEVKFAHFISKINSAALETVLFQDSAVRDKVMRVELVIVSNVILAHYGTILHSLKMATFPFADHFLKNIHVPNKLIDFHKTTNSNQVQIQPSNNGSLVPVPAQNSNQLVQVQELVAGASMILTSISDQVSRSKTTLNSMDHNLIITSFYTSKSTIPFYVWEHRKFQFPIRKLLSGQSVVLKADISKSPTKNYGYGAVKFSKVNINFRAAPVNKDDNPGALLARVGLLAELNSELENYRIKMTHLGNSAYSYDGKYYSIPSPPIAFTFSLQKDSSGLPSNRNAGYDKMSAGDILLSPYALWKIHIAPFDSKRNFTILEALANSDDFQFDLELIGNGTYVENGSGSRLKIGEYYQVDESIQAEAS